MSYTQEVYVVNCNYCSGLIEVVNPRLGKRPTKVYPTDWGLTLSGEIVRIRCPHCGREVWVKFIYD